jgi:hypothetical protein
MRVTTFIPVLLMSVAVLACSGPERGQPSAGVRSPTPPETTTGQLNVRVVASATYRGATVLLANDQYLLRQQKSNTSRIGVSNRATGAFVFTVPAPRHMVSSVALDGDWIAWTRTLTGTEARLHAVNLRTGQTRATTGGAGGLRAIGQPQSYDLHDGVLAYVTQDRVRTNCITVVDLTTGQEHSRSCTKTRQRGTAMPHLSDHGLVFNQWLPRPKPQGCVRLRVNVTAPAERTVPSTNRCAAWSGVLATATWPGPSRRGPPRNAHGCSQSWMANRSR